MMELNGYALVTGAGSGLGLATANAFASHGCPGVCFADINPSTADKAAVASQDIATNPAYKPVSFYVDVADRASIQQLIQELVKIFPRIDYAVNCAGILGDVGKTVDEVGVEEFEKVLRVNATGTFNFVGAMAGVMRGQEKRTLNEKTGAMERGSMVLFSSVAGIRGGYGVVAYSASKHAVLGILKTAAIELTPIGIRVNAVCPGLVDTPMVNNDMPSVMKDGILDSIPMQRIAGPEEIASVVLFLCGPGGSYTTGESVTVDGAYTLGNVSASSAQK